MLAAGADVNTAIPMRPGTRPGYCARIDHPPTARTALCGAGPVVRMPTLRPAYTAAVRIDRRRLSAALAGLLVVVLLILGSLAGVRWSAAGEPTEVIPPSGATTQLPEGEQYETVVDNRAHIIALGLRTDRGAPAIGTYALPPGLPWLQARKLVATQLDHWEQIGDCADNPEARTVECRWREPTRWWPREVRIALMRPPPAGQPRNGWPDVTILIIGAGKGR